MDTEIGRYENFNHTTRYRLMSNGKVLRQFKISGKWEGPTHVLRKVFDGLLQNGMIFKERNPSENGKDTEVGKTL